MWELDYKDRWAPKNWCFWTVVWRRLLRVPWTARRSNQSILKETTLNIHWKDWCWSSNTLVPDVKNRLTGKEPDTWKDWRQEKKGTTEDEMVGWHHRLHGHGFGWTPGVGDGQRSLVCCSPWCLKESDMTERLNWLTACLHILRVLLLLNICFVNGTVWVSFYIMCNTGCYSCLTDEDE